MTYTSNHALLFYTGTKQCKERLHQESLFSNYQTLSTISLLLKQRLNLRNYSKQEIIMNLFA
jgi:hypothetical protein